MTHCRSAYCVPCAEVSWCRCGCLDCREMHDAEDAGDVEIQNAEKGEPNGEGKEV
jgi:hypothetical protein